MTRLGFRRSILVDASVNLVPFGILVVLLAFFVLYDPWPAALRPVLVAVSLLLIPMVVLLAATAVVALVLQADEETDR